MRISLSILVLLIFSCSNEQLFESKYEVPPEFHSIIETFILEAAARDRFIEIDNLIIQYDENQEVCGRCNSTNLQDDIQKVITINPDGLCWNSELQLETLLFHELGHCILGRLHINELLPNSDPKSLMVENDTNLYTGCVYKFGEEDDCDNTFKREYYLDELFDENIPIPAWAD